MSCVAILPLHMTRDGDNSKERVGVCARASPHAAPHPSHVFTSHIPCLYIPCVLNLLACRGVRLFHSSSLYSIPLLSIRFLFSLFDSSSLYSIPLLFIRFLLWYWACLGSRSMKRDVSFLEKSTREKGGEGAIGIDDALQMHCNNRETIYN